MQALRHFVAAVIEMTKREWGHMRVKTFNAIKHRLPDSTEGMSSELFM